MREMLRRTRGHCNTTDVAADVQCGRTQMLLLANIAAFELDFDMEREPVQK
jgi:hypothetical protein